MDFLKELFIWLENNSAAIIGYIGMALVILSWCFKDLKTVRLINVAGAALCAMYGYITSTPATMYLNIILLLLNVGLLVSDRIKRQKEKVIFIKEKKHEDLK